MTTIRPFTIFDLLKYSNIVLRAQSDTFYTVIYWDFICKSPEYWLTLENSASKIQGYILGRAEGDKSVEKREWHGHVTQLAIDPYFRNQGLAKTLMTYLEKISIKTHNAWYMDLFVRSSNTVAIDLYKQLGYTLYRKVLDFYVQDSINPTEDAWTMRKSMPRDVRNELMIPLDSPDYPHQL